ncbi:hypothetical protein AAG570_002266 [Ranatra chinensis]|uniref:DNA damage-binding protein 2 n=1 Tax=Ranatra chinensis TaxID=642074 RepID=A0ABD0YVE3_9HEMI
MGRKPAVKPQVTVPPSPKNTIEKETRLHNTVLCYDQFQRGRLAPSVVRHAAEFVVSERLKCYTVFTSCSCLTRRVTALSWHPTNNSLLLVGSKGGEFIVCGPTGDRREPEQQRHTLDQGIGPGGSLLSIAFDLTSPSRCYTASLDGTVKEWNIDSGDSKVLLNTGTLERWFCSLNTSQSTGLIVAGDTSGVLTVMSGRDKGILSKHKLHKSKITTTEMCNRTGWLLVTASIDKAVKIWDIRKLKECSPLDSLIHERPVNSAFLSPTGSGRLLTTDQHSQLRIYRTGDWALETLMIHPHRQFQHLTAIKASWHPLCDMVVVGRYPDPALPSFVEGELRTVDIFSAKTGKLMAQLSSPSCKGIMSLNTFDPTGEYLASAMGLCVPIWAFRDPLQIKKSKKLPHDGSSNLGADNDDGDDDTFRPPPPKKIKKREKKGEKK